MWINIPCSLGQTSKDRNRLLRFDLQSQSLFCPHWAFGVAMAFCFVYRDNDHVIHPIVRASDPSLPKKMLRRGNVIQDGDTEQHVTAAPAIKIREKRQRN